MGYNTSIHNKLNDTVVAVSDGSFELKFVTVCWILENSKGIEMIMCLIDVTGYSIKHDAYRSELAGLYDILIVVSLLEKRRGYRRKCRCGI